MISVKIYGKMSPETAQRMAFLQKFAINSFIISILVYVHYLGGLK